MYINSELQIHMINYRTIIPRLLYHLFTGTCMLFKISVCKFYQFKHIPFADQLKGRIFNKTRIHLQGIHDYIICNCFVVGSSKVSLVFKRYMYCSVKVP